MGRTCLVIYVFLLLILLLVTWQDVEKHGILYWSSIIILTIALTSIGIMLAYLIGAIGLLLTTMITDTSPFW